MFVERRRYRNPRGGGNVTGMKPFGPFVFPTLLSVACGDTDLAVRPVGSDECAGTAVVGALAGAGGASEGRVDSLAAT